MKKTNFLKGLAMAAIALVSVFTTSCSEEELSIKGSTVTIPELAAPVATVSVSVVDFEKGALLQTTNVNASENIGGTLTVNCPSLDGFTTAKSVTITIPNIAKGQAIVIPVTFYVVPVGSAVEKFVEQLGGNLKVDESIELKDEVLEAPSANITANEEGAFVNDGEEAIVLKATFSYYTGYELYTEGKSISAADLAKLQPELVTKTFEFQMAPNTIITFEPTQEKEVVILPLDGAEYKLVKYGKFDTGMKVTSIGHGHGHDHGHGNGNAGGGEGNDNN